MIKYEFKKGEFNKFNSINQDLKHLFSSYSLYNGIAFGDKIPETGYHYAKVDYTLPGLDSNIIITINSSKLFSVQKEYSKFIKGYMIDNENFYLMMKDMDDIIIGVANEYNGIAATRKYNNYITTKDIIESSREYIHLTESDIEDLLVFKTKVIVISGPFKVYITKDIIPNLKKNDCIDISFYETEISTIFEMLIRVCKGGTTTTYHRYRCLYI